MIAKLKKEEFLANKENKQRFICLLRNKLQQSGCSTIHAEGDADLLIVQTAIQSSRSITTVLVGDDTDLLVLLCHHAEMNTNELFFKPEPKQRSKTRKTLRNTTTVSYTEVSAKDGFQNHSQSLMMWKSKVLN